MGNRLTILTSFAMAMMLIRPGDRALAGGTFGVSNANDAGAGSLRQAILDADTAGGGTINFGSLGPIALASPLPIVTAATTINGNNTIVSGNNQYRVFFIDAPPGAAVNLNNLVIIAGRAKGGDGGVNAGGGLGAGGGLFANSGNVILTNVTFSANSAVGGKGGDGGSNRYGGGGGLGGSGGNLGGGGGGYGGNGGSSVGGGGGIDFPGADGDFTVPSGGAGGGQGGVGPAFGGGTSGFLAGGGGGSLSSPGGAGAMNLGGNAGRFGGGGGIYFGPDSVGGNGGEFGGGGGSTGRGGAGGFGGGGGGGGSVVGGNGGFGGGGSGSVNPGGTGLPGAFAGAGAASTDSNYVMGGGGAALGGHVFVRPGALLTLNDVATDAGSVIGGAGGHSAPGAQPAATATAGGAAGDALFLTGPTTLSVSQGQTRAIGDIGDIGSHANDPTAAGFIPATLIKSGGGVLDLLTAPQHTGGTIISQGTLEGPAFGMTTVPITLNDANTGSADTTLPVTSPRTLVRSITVDSAGSGVSTLGSTAGNSSMTVFGGTITLNRSANLLGQVTTPLPANHDGGQTRVDGAIVGAGGVTITGGNMVQFRSGAKTYTGTTRVTGNSALSLWDSTSTPVNSTIQIDAGSTLFLEGVQGLSPAVIGGLSGGGTVAQNPAYLRADVNVGGNNADASFSGKITGRVGLTKVGAGTQELGAQDNTSLGLYISSGRLRLIGNQHLSSLTVPKTAAGMQALDLNGKTVDVENSSVFLASSEADLNASVGTAADGIYDSTATPDKAVGIAWQSPSNHLIMKLTLAGDANVDGVVNFSDLVTLAQNYGNSAAPTWDQGDFNYDDKVDFNDLVRLAQNYNQSLAASLSAVADALAAAQVPEPSSACVIVVLAGCAVGSRRSRVR